MSDLAKITFREVQAALLNSECDPGTTVEQALRAAAQMAVLECGDSEESWVEKCREAFRGAQCT